MLSIEVSTEWQKELLEMVGSYREQKKRKYDDVEAAFIYLFFCSRKIFGPFEYYSPSVKLTYNQWIWLKDQLLIFLSSATELGFELEVKEAIKTIDALISVEIPRANLIKIRLKSLWRYLKIATVIFLFSLIIFSFHSAGLLACFGSLLYLAVEERIKNVLNMIDNRNASRSSIILKQLNVKEIQKYLEWAESHLEKQGFLREESCYPTKPDIKNRMKPRWGYNPNKKKQ